jgi:molecular chaperone IbpA
MPIVGCTFYKLAYFKESIMSKHSLEKFFDQFDQFFVGFEPLFNSVTASGYPPHNILQKSDNKFVLELACAGFKKTEVSLKVKEGLFTVTGKKESESDESKDEYQYRGLASRAFTKSFRIAEFYEVTSATLEDGILSVTFEKEVPEEAPTKIIPIK